VNRQQLLNKIDKSWAAFAESRAGLSPSEMTDGLVTPAWSVKDIVSHVTWWEEEALKHLPQIAEGRRPPKYSAMYGGVDAFNALMTEERRGLTLTEVLQRSEAVHGELVTFVADVPEALIASDTRFRRRLRLDTYGHYPLHARAIREWRTRSPVRPS
jgi:hypothetical protein